MSRRFLFSFVHLVVAFSFISAQAATINPRANLNPDPPRYSVFPPDKSFFSTDLHKNFEKKRNYLWPPLASFVMPGFDQWWENQNGPAIVYTSSAVAGVALQSASIAGSDNISSSVDSRDDRARGAMLGSQIYMAAGSFSAYSSFRTAVKSRKPYGQFGFLKHDETTDDLLLSPFDMRMLARPTTYIPIGIGLAIAAISLSGNGPVFEHNGFTGADAGFAGGFSYLAGTNEEALFRGTMMPGFMQVMDSPFWSNTTTALIFGAAHISGDNAVPWPQFALGWYLGYLSQRNDWTLRESIFIHAWWDVIAFTSSYLYDSRDPRYKSAIVMPLATIPF